MPAVKAYSAPPVARNLGVGARPRAGPEPVRRNRPRRPVAPSRSRFDTTNWAFRPITDMEVEGRAAPSRRPPPMEAAIETLKQQCMDLLDVVFPPRCAGCDAPRGAEHLFCSVCRRTVHTVDPPRCPLCARPRPRSVGAPAHVGVDDLCTRCITSSPAQDGATARWRYRGAVADALQRGKYGDDPWRLAAVGRHLAGWMARAAPDASTPAPDASCAETMRVAPVPSHRSELRDRGYNPTAVIADAALDRLGAHRPPTPLEKVADIPPQAGLARAQRLDNVRGAFAPRNGADPTGTWILFDDVMATGATVSQAAGALLAAGAERVVAMVAARSCG